jgi:hypothetical protein
MRGAGVLLNLAVVLLAGSPCAPAAQTRAPPRAAGGLILGRAVDAASGRAIAGAVVSLENVSMIAVGDGEKKAQDIRIGGI